MIPTATPLLASAAGLSSRVSDVLCSPCRQCAVVALQDVKAYLTEESGQIAVSLPCPFPVAVPALPGLHSPPLHPSLVGSVPQSPLIDLVRSLPRCLMPPTPPGRGGT